MRMVCSIRVGEGWRVVFACVQLVRAGRGHIENRCWAFLSSFLLLEKNMSKIEFLQFEAAGLFEACRM